MKKQSKFVRRNVSAICMALAMLVSMMDVAPATEQVWEGEVRAVSQTQRPQQGFRHRQASTGAVLGAAIGTLAVRNSSYEKRAVAGLIGGVIGGGVGSRRDRNLNDGWDVVVCDTSSSYRRCSTLFLEEQPWFREGDLVFVASDRLIFAGRSESYR